MTNTNIIGVSNDDFRKLLCIPEDYRMCDIDN